MTSMHILQKIKVYPVASLSEPLHINLWLERHIWKQDLEKLQQHLSPTKQKKSAEGGADLQTEESLWKPEAEEPEKAASFLRVILRSGKWD